GNSFCREFISSTVAAGGVGKSALRMLQAIAYVTGRDLTGEHVFKRGRALIVSLEDSRKELRRRVLAARLRYQIPPAELKGLYLSAPGVSAGRLMTLDPKTRQTKIGEMVGKIEYEIVTNKIDLVIIDPFIKAHAVPENDNSAMDQVVQLLTDLTVKYNIAL